jgi:hypothetical protein
MSFDMLASIEGFDIQIKRSVDLIFPPVRFLVALAGPRIVAESMGW